MMHLLLDPLPPPLTGNTGPTDDLHSKPPTERVVIGIAGVPGAGKTTLATALVQRINAAAAAAAKGPQIEGSEPAPIAVALPMDGFHYSRAQLAAMPNAAEAIHRRGAAFTFDGDGFLALVRALTTPTAAAAAAEEGTTTTTKTIYAPSFAHEIKDPVADAIAIPPGARIVLIEGNYCALNRAPWRDAAGLMSRLWYVDTPAEVTQARLAKRHLASGIVADEKEAWERASGSDEENARDIRENLLEVDEVIPMC